MAFLYGRTWTRDELLRHVGHMDQLAGIKLMEGADGVERGGRILEVWTGSGLIFQVLAERALDISACSYQGQSLVWRSAAGDATPIYYSADGLDWLRTFPGGLLATCGLDYFGPPMEDNGETFGIHGRIGALPATQVAYRTWWDGDEYELSISAEVRQYRLFGEYLVLRREIRTRLGSRVIAIHDSVTNAGYTPQPHMILYHFNFGFPLLSADSQVELATSETYPRDSRAAPGIHDWRTFHGPTAGWQEQVFRHTPIPNEQGWSKAVLRNPPLGLAVALRFDARTLPFLFQWKQTGEGAYVLGLEPGNCSGIEGRAVARERGDLPVLEAGETRHYHLELEVNPAL
ncbi:MAG: aldose 1-epimerase family protein [Anaerolineae bacterium]